ncbi:MAG: S8 family serine peptidase [Candidatus Coatesbacteria bacterium]|nr:S8 family serine peptidase [Candidatus Coatesbacteria bacterium]
MRTYQTVSLTVFLLTAILFLGALLAASGADSELDERACLVTRQPDGSLPDAIDDSLVVLDYGSFVLVNLRLLAIEQLIASGVVVEDLSGRTLVRLGNYTFDPVDGPGLLPAALRLSEEDRAASRYVIVQWHGPLRRDFLESLEAAGARCIQYIPDFGMLVRRGPIPVQSLLAFDSVRAVSAFEPAYKVERVLLKPLGVQRLAVHLDKVPDFERVVGLLSEFGEVMRAPAFTASRIIVRLRADTANVPKIASIPEVIVVGLCTEPGKDDEVQDQIVSLGLGDNGLPTTGYRDFLESVGVTGAGVPVAVCDTGVDTGSDYESMHPDLRGRVHAVIDYKGNAGRDYDGHGTHCAGIIAGNGASGARDSNGFEVGLGVAPGAQIVTQNFLADWFDIPIVDLLGDAYSAGARIHSNSWGDGYYSERGYTSTCIEWDMAVLDVEPDEAGTQRLIVVKSAGNDGEYGSSTISSPGEAKNTIAIGATENYRPEKGCTNTNSLAYFSSRGMCEDGRVKPDVCCPGKCIISALSSESYPGWCEGSFGSLHEYCSGTSMACPAASGSAALLAEKVRNETGNLPSPSLVRAWMIATAFDMPEPSNRPIPNEDEGWGRIDLSAMLSPDADIVHYDEEVSFTETGEDYITTVSVGSAAEPFKVALAWQDSPGALHAQPALVNDLDLIVTGSDGTEYLGNSFANGFSNPGGQPDRRNNVECVFIESPQGQYTIRVVAHQITIDSTPGTSGIQQPFALFVSNALDISSKAWMRFSESAYRCDAEVEVTLADLDLAQAPSVTIMAGSTYAPEERLEVTLFPDEEHPGLFSGTFNLTPADESTHGAVRIAHGHFVGALYIDEDDGMGGHNIETVCYAQADCEGPILQTIQISQSESGRVHFVIGASEPCSVKIGYWDASCEVKYIHSLGQNKDKHDIDIVDLYPCSRYWSVMELTDAYGNATIWDNDGQLFTFETKYYAPEAYTGGEIGDDDGWSSEASAGEAWHKSSRRAYSGSSSWYCGSESSGSYGNSWDTSLISEEFVVTAGAKLRFAVYCLTESSYDYLKAYVWRDGQDALTPLPGMSFSGNSSGWKTKEASLEPFEGQTIRIRFRFTSDGSSNDEGCYIDECMVTAEGDCAAGILLTDQDVYTCSQTIHVALLDSDLGQDPASAEKANVRLRVLPSGFETDLTLTEVAADSSRFSGEVPLSPDGAPGTLPVSHDDLLWFAYTDPFPSGPEGETVVLTAPIDCEAPVVTDYRSVCSSPEAGTIQFTTDTPSRALLHFLGADGAVVAQDSETISRQHEIKITGLKECTEYQFCVELWDNVGNYRLVDNGGLYYTFETPRESVSLEDDCERGEGEWTHRSNYGPDQWHLSTRRSVSGSHSWFCGTDTGDYADSMECLLSLDPVEWLPGSVLTFQTLYSLESGYDYGYVEVFNPGTSSWRTLQQVNGSSGGWGALSINLPDYGKPSALRFRMKTDAYTVYEGWYVDDISIKGLWDCHSATLELGRRTIGCTCTELAIELSDLDLNTDKGRVETVDVTVSSGGTGDSITATLSEVNANSSKFTGIVLVTDEDRHGAANTIRVADVDSLCVSYWDEMYGPEKQPRMIIENASTDCVRPEVLDFGVVPLGASDALASCTISRPVGCVFRCESVSSGDGINVAVAGPKERFAIMVSDLETCEEYHFTLQLVDAVGNQVLIDSASPEYSFTFGYPWTGYSTGFGDPEGWATGSLKPVYRPEEDVWKWNALGGADGESGYFCAKILADVESVDAVLVSPPVWAEGAMTVSFAEKHTSSNVQLVVEAAVLPSSKWVDITPFEITHLSNNRWQEVRTVFSTNSDKCRFRIRALSSQGASPGSVLIDSFKVTNDIGCEPRQGISCSAYEYRVNSTINMELQVSPGNLTGEYFLTAAVISSSGQCFYYPNWSLLPSFVPLDFTEEGPLTMTLVDHTISNLADAIGLQGYWLVEATLYDGVGRPLSRPTQKGFLVTPQVDLPPCASLAASPVAAAVEEVVLFDASASFDDVTSQDALLFRWDLDADGVWDSDLGQSSIMEMRFEYSGAFEVLVEVMDSLGQTGVAAQGVYVY